MSDVIQQFTVGQQAPEFHDLLGVDGRRYSLASFAGKPLLVIAVIGNGCSTVKLAITHAKN